MKFTSALFLFLILFLFHFMLLCPNQLGSIAHAADSAEFLHEKGRQAFSKGDFLEAKTYLQKLLNSFPADPRSRDSLPLLGEASKNLGELPQAIEAYQRYVERAPSRIEGIRARIKITELRLQAKRSDEALLGAREILEKRKESTLPRAIEIEARILEIRALLDRKRPEEAKIQFQSLSQYLLKDEKENDGLGLQFHELGFSIELALCDLLLQSKNLSEEELLAEFRQKGQCLIQTLQRSIQAWTKHPGWNSPDLTKTKDSFENYLALAENPPLPQAPKTPEQTALYLAEIKTVLKRETEKTRSLLLEWIQSGSSLPGWDARGFSHKLKEAIKS